MFYSNFHFVVPVFRLFGIYPGTSHDMEQLSCIVLTMNEIQTLFPSEILGKQWMDKDSDKYLWKRTNQVQVVIDRGDRDGLVTP